MRVHDVCRHCPAGGRPGRNRFRSLIFQNNLERELAGLPVVTVTDGELEAMTGAPGQPVTVRLAGALDRKAEKVT